MSEVAQLCPTLCDPIDYSLPGSSVHGISQARVLEWVAISFSNGKSQILKSWYITHKLPNPRKQLALWLLELQLIYFINCLPSLYHTIPFHLAAYSLITSVFNNNSELLLFTDRLAVNSVLPLAVLVKISFIFWWSRYMSFSSATCCWWWDVRGQMLETQVNCRIVELGKVVVEILSYSISGHFCISSPQDSLCWCHWYSVCRNPMLACSMCS